MNFLGFSFYGAGNIGDDLMLDGFLTQGGSGLHLVGYVPRPVSCLVRRAPDVTWMHDVPGERRQGISTAQRWIGVGDTPFQATSGTWLLDQIADDMAVLPGHAIATMCGVGAESEVMRHRDLVVKICARLDRIATRDAFSAEILLDCLPPEQRSKIRVGSDLAHISLKRLFPSAPDQGPRRHGVGICYYSESINPSNFAALQEMIRSSSRRERMVLIANETRPEFESDIYSRMLGWKWLRNAFPSLLAPRIILPPYQEGGLEELVGFYADIETVLSSRYHSLLTAAWAGCRLAALSRSSKIVALAKELDIPLVSEPFTPQAIRTAIQEARVVPRAQLLDLALLAASSVHDTLGSRLQGLPSSQARPG